MILMFDKKNIYIQQQLYNKHLKISPKVQYSSNEKSYNPSLMVICINLPILQISLTMKVESGKLGAEPIFSICEK